MSAYRPSPRARLFGRAILPIAVALLVLWGLWFGYRVVVGDLDGGSVARAVMDLIALLLAARIGWGFRRADAFR